MGPNIKIGQEFKPDIRYTRVLRIVSARRSSGVGHSASGTPTTHRLRGQYPVSNVARTLQQASSVVPPSNAMDDHGEGVGDSKRPPM